MSHAQRHRRIPPLAVALEPRAYLVPGSPTALKLAAIRHMSFPVDALHGGSHGGRLDPQPCGEAQTHQRRCAALPLPAALARLSSQDALLTGRLCARPSLSHAPATGTDRDNLSNHRHHQDTQFRGNQKGCAVGDPPRRLEDLVVEVAGDEPRRHPASKRKTPTGVLATH